MGTYVILNSTFLFHSTSHNFHVFDSLRLENLSYWYFWGYFGLMIWQDHNCQFLLDSLLVKACNYIEAYRRKGILPTESSALGLSLLTVIVTVRRWYGEQIVIIIITSDRPGWSAESRGMEAESLHHAGCVFKFVMFRRSRNLLSNRHRDRKCCR